LPFEQAFVMALPIIEDFKTNEQVWLFLTGQFSLTCLKLTVLLEPANIILKSPYHRLSHKVNIWKFYPRFCGDRFQKAVQRAHFRWTFICSNWKIEMEPPKCYWYSSKFRPNPFSRIFLAISLLPEFCKTFFSACLLNAAI
jgi:hypothetical protein